MVSRRGCRACRTSRGMTTVIPAVLAAVYLLLCHCSAAPSQTDVSSLSAQLKSPDPDSRDKATAELPSYGSAAVEPVTVAALSDDLEVGLRAVHILEAIYKADQIEAVDIAEFALRRLVNEAHPAVSQEASDVLSRNYFGIVQKRAVYEIRKLGGQVQYETDRAVFVDGQPHYPPGGWVIAVAIGKDWKGGNEGLVHVRRLETLRACYLLRGHSLSQQAIESLRTDLPSMEIMQRGAAFVGVATQPDSIGCTITSVKPGSPADKSGLIQGDIVVEIAGRPVQQPDDLVKIIGDNDPGATVSVVVLRGDPLLRFKLIEMLNDPDSYSPLLIISIMQQIRTVVPVELEPWQIDN